MKALQKTITTELENQVAIGLASAISVCSINRNSELLCVGTSGVHSATQLRAFSCGKPLVAAILWRLHDKGLVDWHDPISKYWPEFANRHPEKQLATIEHVLTHRVGLPSDHEISPHQYRDWGAVIRYLEEAPLEYSAGERYEYRALTFGWLVAEIASRIANKPFCVLLREEVTGPLKLNNTFFAIPRAHHGNVVPLFEGASFEMPGLAVDFEQILAEQVVMPGVSTITTAIDLARFYSALLSGGGEWLSAKAVREITMIRYPADPNNNEKHAWALGMSRCVTSANTYGEKEPGHAYGQSGIGTAVAFADPVSGLAICILSNKLQDSATNTMRLKRIIAALRGTSSTANTTTKGGAHYN